MPFLSSLPDEKATCGLGFCGIIWKPWPWWHKWNSSAAQTHLLTSERAGCPPPAPVSRLEHTDRPQSRQWSQPSRTTDLSARQNEFSSFDVIFVQNHTFPHPAPVLYTTVLAKCWFRHYGHLGGCWKVVLMYCSCQYFNWSTRILKAWLQAFMRLPLPHLSVLWILGLISVLYISEIGLLIINTYLRSLHCMSATAWILFLITTAQN